jgi:hypothetical protein
VPRRTRDNRRRRLRERAVTERRARDVRDRAR